MGEYLPSIPVGRNDPESKARRLRARRATASPKLVGKIVQEVRNRGDRALLEYVKKFEGATIGRRRLRVSEGEIRAARRRVEPNLKSAIKDSLNRLRRVQSELLRRVPFELRRDGVRVEVDVSPLDSVGCYVPGGRASYASTVVMTAGLAKVAGVPNVVVCTPPSADGRVDDSILATADICGVDSVYRAGGAHAIAAMAYGTTTIPKVSKIIGPGGQYVSMAKLLVSRDVPIDFYAGPTELVVLAGRRADPRVIAWDLVGQAEHGVDTLCALVTWDERLVQSVRKEIARTVRGAAREAHVRGSLEASFAAVCDSEETAIRFVNSLAPEHVEILAEDARRVARRIRAAGLKLVGEDSPCALSDYLAGTDHVIPTGGYARISGGLSALDMVKLDWTVTGSKSGLRESLSSLEALASAEGLPNHYLSVRKRFAPN